MSFKIFDLDALYQHINKENRHLINQYRTLEILIILKNLNDIIYMKQFFIIFHYCIFIYAYNNKVKIRTIVLYK